jgi:hypothetical protein
VAADAHQRAGERVSPRLRRLAVLAYFRRLALDSKPILVGPWRSELGFESMYFLPFLRWAIKAAGIQPERLLVVTRGGAGVLYGLPSVDLYRLRSVDYVRQENGYDSARTGLQKQVLRTAWDNDVLKEAAALTFGRGQKFHVLHPSWMYWALSPFWEQQRGTNYLASMTDYELLPKPAKPAELPESYVAMKWYARHTFPYPHPETQDLVAKVAGAIAARTPVVLLTSGIKADDHTDIVVKGPNITLLPEVSPDQNLALQLSVMAHATACVGVYGGMMQTALRMGVPSVSFYQHFGGTAHAHLSLSSYLSQRSGVPFVVGSLADAHLWKQVLMKPEKQAEPAKELVTA